MDDPTYFDRLGLPRTFDLAPEAIERAYLERSRELHPDFHQLSSTAEQRASLELTSLLNLAYHTLRQPFLRGEYLLRLEGGPTATEARQMEPSFLEEILDLRMRVQQLRLAEVASPELPALEEQLETRRAGLIDALRREFATLATLPPGDAGRAKTLLAVRQTLNAAKYIQGLLDDLRSD